MVHSKNETDPSSSSTSLAENLRQSSQDWVIARPPDTLPALRSSAPWMEGDPKWFRSVVVSPSAVVKMLAHCDSGVTKGIAKGGNPIEVMGMLLGRPNENHQLVVTDAFPLPIEGFETRVVADDQAVVNHMIALGESLERTRCEKFMGWYHSHPFELSQHSHCFLSQTDLSTQLQWQRAEDAHGNPFVAIVVDPLRTRHLQEPVLKAFRAYPPEHAPASPHECPDGARESSEQVRLEKWGSCWNRYYELAVDYRMTPACRRILEQLTSDSLWIRNLSSSSSRRSGLANPAADAARLRGLADQCRAAHSALGLAAASTATSTARGGPGGGTAPTTGAAAAAAAATLLPGALSNPPASSMSPWRGEASAPASSAAASAASSGGTYARSEEAMAALTVAPPPQQLQQLQQLQQQQPLGSGSTGASAAGTGAGSSSSGAAQWAKAVRAVVDAAEDVVCNEHRNAAKGRVFG